MNKKKIYLFIGLLTLAISAVVYTNSIEKNEMFSDHVKIALREVGNQLLLANQDSTSLILPVIELNNSNYKLAFENTLTFEPNQLVGIVDSTFIKAKLPPFYLVSVLQCNDNQVAYSYKMSKADESTIIPCAGRHLPNACYIIELKFTNRLVSFFYKPLFAYVLSFIGLVFLFAGVFLKKKENVKQESIYNSFTSIGNFQFYPEQNKLVREAKEISLSKKECELLELFVAHPNQIIKRDELTKRVWEDNGVFVGRSLDTYISKLRKKLQDDDTIKLTNIHGVGYKLEVN